MRFYLDASTIVYSVESRSPFREAVLSRLGQVEGTPGGILLTSRLSRLECRVKPLRENNAALLATYEGFFTRALVNVIEIGPNIVERATELRARYGLKTPDAIHVATAIEEHADLLLTGDRELARCGEVKVEIL
ncbi:MAG TPA: type II toxin-antitoxin system VapC family toxin [Tepidisphaeraceae bacterium]|jgi:predicted nucleic acid-binding protein|nr:type II toxin-antitoxin system VapC family toxin [Tepidisphaeraceae bacterium]